MTIAAAISGTGLIGRRERLAVAWLGTLLLSRLPEVGLREGFGIDFTWMPAVWSVTAALLILVTFRLPELQALRGYFVVLGSVIVLTSVVDPLVRGSALWQRLVSADAPMVTLLAERVLLVGLSLIVIVGLAAASGGRPAYMGRGDLGAPSGIRLPRAARSLSWLSVGPVAAVLLATATAGAAAAVLPAEFGVGAAIPLLLAGAVAAALNAFAEETLYRAAPLSQLVPAVGTRQAVLLLAVWFGLGHFYGGIPSGPAGAIQAGVVALLFGKAMVDTRGLMWPWTLHFSIDLVIYSAIALSIAALPG
jgi:membrane protease YdiL (CAAX protease family)